MARAFAEMSVAEIQAGLTAKEFSAEEIAKESLGALLLPIRQFMPFLRQPSSWHLKQLLALMQQLQRAILRKLVLWQVFLLLLKTT